MTDEVRQAYDAMADEYTEHALGEFERNPFDRRWLATFAERVAGHDKPVADMGCGPGHVSNHLADLGLTVVGYDLSPALIAEARRAHPDGRFHVGDMTSAAAGDASFGGILSRYSLIHLVPSRLAGVFREWHRVIVQGAPVLVSFFASSSADAHGTAFDHAVVTAYALFPATVAGHLETAGFIDVEVDVRGPFAGARPLDHATILARRGGP